MKKLIRRGIIAALLCAAVVSFIPSSHGQHGVLREVYNNITGGLPGLQSNNNFPGNPSSTEILQEFEAPSNAGNNFGQRVRGYIQAPETGQYIFWISSDQASELYLSTDEQPENRRKIAEVLSAVPPGIWNFEGGQQSTPVTLEAGELYYIEALMVDTTGPDHLAVRWQLPDGTVEEPLPGNRLFVELIPPQVSSHPDNVTVNENEDARFTVQYANRAPVAIQWYQDNQPIPDATNTTLLLRQVELQDSGSRIVAHATNLFSTNPVISATAFLTVRADEIPPAIVSAATSGERDLVTVIFTEPIDPASITTLSNYEIIGGAQVRSASLDPTGRTLILRTTPLEFGQTYTLFINNVRDRASLGNAIEPDSSVDFTYSYSALAPELVYGRAERPGPSSRRTGLVISEIMHTPAPRTDGRNIEFIELFNSQEFIESIGGFRLTGAVEYTFPEGTFIPAREYLVVAAQPVDMQVLFNPARLAGPFTNSLPNSGEIRLLNNQGAVLLEISYESESPWPVAAAGAGNSLVLARPSYGESDPRAWAASRVIMGSPGRAEPEVNDPFAGLVINEVLSHTDLPQLDFLEFYNYSDREIDLSGIVITDDFTTNKFRAPAGLRLAPLGFLRLDEIDLEFALSSAGERIIVRDPGQSRVIAAIDFPPLPNGVPFGRFPDGHPEMRQLSQPTPGTANAAVRLPEIVFNEIMYHPVSRNDDEEYLELFNRSGQAINLRGWRLSGGISHTFTQDFTLPAGGYLTVARNIEVLRSYHTNLTAANSVGNFNGNLANDGERIALERPELLIVSENNRTTTNVLFVVVDELEYGTGGRWPRWADGGGSSMELIDIHSDNDEPSNWRDSDETGKSQWVTIERRGVLSWGATNFPPTAQSRALHVILMDRGEALLDNVEVIRGRRNIVLNPGFDRGTRDWIAGGTHESSTVERGAGSDGGQAMHIRAAARGDTAANRIRARLSSGLTNSEIVTIRADVRWLRGSPDMLLRLHGNYLELAGTMPLPTNLGSPGAPNGQPPANSGPSIEQVQHWPVLPAENQQVRVIAEIADPQQIALATLTYRVDPPTNVLNVSTNYVTVPMSYNGAGFYSALIPGQQAGVGVAFYIDALDASGGTNRFPSAAPETEAVIVFGDATRSGNFGTYRLWLTQTNLNRWRLRERSSNKPLDATFVYNNERIIYNMGTLYSGSPFHWVNYTGPIANNANYLMVMPEDELFLGQTDFVLNLPSNLGSDQSGIREQTVYWMANEVNQPFTHRRYVYLSINGVSRGPQSIFEDAQQPSRDFIEQWFPDDPDGELYKIEDWFEFDEAFTQRFNRDATLNAFYSASLTNEEPQLKQELYRWWFRKRALRESAHDYSELFALVEAMNTPEDEEFARQAEALIDADAWMGAIALRHAVGDWDAFGYRRGKNMYAYKPQNGKWQLLHWDIAFAFQLGDGPFQHLFDTRVGGVEDPVNTRLLEVPVFRRAYLRALHEIANGPMLASRVNSVIDARFAGLVGNGIPLLPPAQVKTWISQRREFILGQLASFSSGFGITSNNGSNVTTNRNTFLLTGTAPVNVHSIRVNGQAFPIEWQTLNSWSTRVALQSRTNVLAVQGFDVNGSPVPGASATLTVNVTGPVEAIAGRVIINEILADPLAPETEFVELHNTSRLSSFDLSGYRLNGLGFTFPAGSVIPPGGFLVVARDALAFANRFGFDLPVAGVFEGAVDDEGELLTLLAPGTNETVVASVRFDNLPPWPGLQDGASWQLIDPAQDPARVGNWGALPQAATPGTTNSIVASLPAFPLVWLNEIQPININGPTDGAGEREPWLEIYNSSNGVVSLGGLYLTDDLNNPQKWPFPSGASLNPGQRALVWLDGEPGTAAEMHAGFRLSSTSSVVALVRLQRGLPAVIDYLRFDQLPAGQSFGAFPEGQASRRHVFHRATPGAANDLSAGPLAVVFNEWMAENSATIADPDDLDFDDWFELHNPGSQPVDLSRFMLSDNPADPGKFVIPDGTVIPARGFLLVWADEEQSANGQLHANFRLASGGETLILSGPDGTIVDQVDFAAQERDVSEGRLPDGGAQVVRFFSPTPGSANVAIDPNALQFRSAVISQGRLVLRWNSEPGATYRVEFTGSVVNPVWTPLGTVTATGGESSIEDALGAGPRFYRVVKL